MATSLTVLPGDGIGPEISTATRIVLEAASRLYELDLSLREQIIGLAALKTYGTTLPAAALAAARDADGVVLGPVSHNVYPPVSDTLASVSSSATVSVLEQSAPSPTAMC